MPDASAHDVTTDAHLRILAEEQLRLSRGSLALRPLAAAGVSLLVVLHAPQNPSRYMFTAGLLTLAAWWTDAQLARRGAALAALAAAVRARGPRRPPAMSVDLAPFEGALGWRRAALGGERLRWFLPMLVVSGAVAIDAQRFGADDVPGEVVWYLALLIASLGAASLGAWSWWLDRFGDEATPPPSVAPTPALAARVSLAPPSLERDDPDLARWVPKHDPNERPFPELSRPSQEPPAPRSGSTQTFATVEAEAIAADPAVK